MAKHLWVVANCTSSDAALTSTQVSEDNITIGAMSISHTGGKDNNYINIPNCSDSEYFKKYHLLIKSDLWTVSLWTNDNNNFIIYWSRGEFYSEENAISASSQYDNCGILITLENNEVMLRVSEW